MTERNSTKAWRCNVCGYVHYGDQPPECCPVCGAAAVEFEIYVPEKTTAGQVTSGVWLCMICGYTHIGPEPPAVCPVCSAAADKFERQEATQTTIAKAAQTVVIVGAGIAGLSAAQAVRDNSPHSEIILLSKEKHLPYYRLNLTRYLAGEISETELPIHPRQWYRDQRIDLRCEVEVVAISPTAKTIELHNGEQLKFDKLILATGAHPWIPPIPGANKPGVYSVRTCDDANQILTTLRQGMRCVCIGGGILGIETAAALARHGVKVTMVESFPWLMPRQLNERGGQVLQRHIAALGIELRLQARIKEITGQDRVNGILLEDGSQIPGEMVIITAGVRANTHLARKAELQVNNGIVVANHLTSSHSDVLAAGDVAEYQGNQYGLWAPAQYQGNIAGLNAAGIATEFGGIPRSNTLKVISISLFSIGQFTGTDGSYLPIAAESDGKFYHFLFHDNRLVGAILIGDTSIAPMLKKAVESAMDLSQLLQQKPTAAAVVKFMKG